jgi:hypothetical protein
MAFDLNAVDSRRPELEMFFVYFVSYVSLFVGWLVFRLVSADSGSNADFAQILACRLGDTLHRCLNAGTLRAQVQSQEASSVLTELGSVKDGQLQLVYSKVFQVVMSESHRPTIQPSKVCAIGNIHPQVRCVLLQKVAGVHKIPFDVGQELI